MIGCYKICGDHQAVLTGVKGSSKTFEVPEKTEINGKEYDIIGLEDFTSNGLKHLTFSKKSKVETVNIGLLSEIRRVDLPASLKQIVPDYPDEEEYHRFTIDPQNRFLKFQDGNIISASSPTIIVGSPGKYKSLVREGIECIGDFAHFFNESLTFIYLPSSLMKISTGSFCGCRNLRSLVFPPNCNLKYIGEHAFEGCNEIRKIVFPNKLRKICKNAFCACFSLCEIEFDQNSDLKIIDGYAFNSTSLVEIKLPRNIIELGQGSFGDCNYLKKVLVSKSVYDKIINDFPLVVYCEIKPEIYE